MFRKILTYLFVGSLITSCAGGKYAATEKVYHQKAKQLAKVYKDNPSENQVEKIASDQREWIASTNFGMRKPNYVMIHHTAQKSLDQTVKTFHNQKVGVSSHYVISRDGKIVQMVNDYFRAHHAGAGRWGNDTDLNSSSIGIELDNNGISDPWPQVQIDALVQLLDYLKKSYNIPQANFIGHMDYAPGRKIDPANFPWKVLADKGFGFWYPETLPEVPVGFDPKLALRIIGFNVQNLEVAIKGFKHHYIQQGSATGDLSDYELRVLYSVLQNFL